MKIKFCWGTGVVGPTIIRAKGTGEVSVGHRQWHFWGIKFGDFFCGVMKPSFCGDEDCCRWR